MADFNQLLQNYVNQPYEELLGLARYSLAQASDEISDFFSGNDELHAKAYMVITAACLGADSKLTTLEYNFLKDLLDMDVSYDDMKSMIEALYGDEAMELTDQLADSLSNDAKSALISFCICLLAVDETISREEVDFIAKLMS